MAREEDAGVAPFQETLEVMLDWIDGCGDCFYDSTDEYLDGLQFISGDEGRLDGFGTTNEDSLIGLAYVPEN